MDTQAYRHPVLFLGHGSPMNALEDTAWSRAWKELGETLQRPRAIVAVSAHWWTDRTQVTANAQPPTIHDFGGFPRALFETEYPAPGDPELAAALCRRLDASPTIEWGLDHGTWSLLVHLFPDADVPVLQVSLDARAVPAQHLALGRNLSALRDEGILLLFSGNVTHNLQQAMRQAGRGDTAVPGWASAFHDEVGRALAARDVPRLLDLHATPSGRLSHPAPDHWFPLVAAFGASRDDDALTSPCRGWDMGNLAMTAYRWG
jgi:4,5-DOPA dioxygenase extradiol